MIEITQKNKSIEKVDIKPLTLRELKELDTIELVCELDELSLPTGYYKLEPILDNYVIKRKDVNVEYIHVNYLEKIIEYYVYDKENYEFNAIFAIYLDAWEYEFTDDALRNISVSFFKDFNGGDNYLCSIIDLIFKSIFGINYTLENRETEYVLKERTTVSSTKNNGGKAKRMTYSILSGTKTVYTYITRSDKDKKSYDRHTDSWIVVGHLRHYKNGKTVWIAPFVKGKGNRNVKNILIK